MTAPNEQTELTWYDLPDLRRPLLLVAFEGMFDAASAASAALQWIRERGEAAEVAMIDPEQFFNFQEARPTVRFDRSGNRVVDWPVNEVFSVGTEAGRDFVVLTGVEPHLRWSSFAKHVVDIARRTRCEMVVTVGAFVGMVPHTRPFAVTGSAAHPELVRRLNLTPPTYEGPTGLIGVIIEQLEQANIPAISLRVEVPHYVPGAPNPKATRALLRRLQHTTGVETGYEQLDSDVNDWIDRVDQAVEADDESRDYVARLEQQADSNEELLPSGDDLAGELEAFLRDQPQGGHSQSTLDIRETENSTDAGGPETETSADTETSAETDTSDGDESE